MLVLEGKPMATEKGACGNGTKEGSCPCCVEGNETWYWCDICRQAFPEKRCPQCGLKLKKMG